MRREGRGPELLPRVAEEVGSEALLAASSPAPAVSDAEGGGWAGASAQGDSAKGSIVAFVLEGDCHR